MSRQTDNFYNHFSFFYPVVDLFLKPQKHKLFQEINKLPYGQLLEIGVGNGSHLKLYKTHQVTGIDTSVSMLEVAKKHKTENIQLLQMNGEKLLFPDQTFDYVILSHVIAVVDFPEKVLEETYRVLKPDGQLFILNHFTPNNWLRHIDKVFQVFSKAFHFKSVFHIDSLTTIKKFRLLFEINFGQFSYFKLLIYKKA
ncbi:MAG: class I SAM-dependent methyltransferase [Pedobacter sp.]|nr:MAG: class I SAM-dependent methyltransferase [Pedobacter sp.]